MVLDSDNLVLHSNWSVWSQSDLSISLWAAEVPQESGPLEETMGRDLLFWHHLQLLPYGNSARGGTAEEAAPSGQRIGYQARGRARPLGGFLRA